MKNILIYKLNVIKLGNGAYIICTFQKKKLWFMLKIVLQHFDQGITNDWIYIPFATGIRC